MLYRDSTTGELEGWSRGYASVDEYVWMTGFMWRWRSCRDLCGNGL